VAKINCAISGLPFETSYITTLRISHTVGYKHPIFFASQTDLYKLYNAHTHNRLTPIDSYLLFLAFLDSSDQIVWTSPATRNPTDNKTIQLIENNISQLVHVLEKTNLISSKSFTQPSFRVTFDTSSLEAVPNWIAAWEENLTDFKIGRADNTLQEALYKVEKTLSYLLSNDIEPENYSKILADWACKAGIFPADKAELYKKTIASCYNPAKMFATPLPLLKEIKDYCECNIDIGSVHFYTLMKVLKAGVARHLDYLGLDASLARGYTLLPSLSKKEADTKNAASISSILSSAPQEEPLRIDYPDAGDFIRAKLAYRLVLNKRKADIVSLQEKEAALDTMNSLDDVPDVGNTSDTSIGNTISVNLEDL